MICCNRWSTETDNMSTNGCGHRPKNRMATASIPSTNASRPFISCKFSTCGLATAPKITRLTNHKLYAAPRIRVSPARNANQKFWTNSFSTGLDFQYARHGSVNIGYGNRILEYDQSDGNNYKSHSVNIGTSYQFTDQWNSSLSYNYTDANYDSSDNYTDENFVDSEDYTTHDAGFNLGYSHSVWNSYSAGVNYNEKNYETESIEISDDNRNDYSDTRNDWYTVSGNLGWTHAFSPTKTLSPMFLPPTWRARMGF